MAKTNTKKDTKNSTHSTASKVCNSATFVSDVDRLRSFSLELYASPEHWGSLLENSEHYAYVYHDRDVREDGSPKTAHYHLLVCFKNAKTKSAVLKLTNIELLEKDTTVNFQKLLNRKNAFRYLMHDTPEAIIEGKARYNADEVKCDDLNYWIDVKGEGENEEFLTDLLEVKSERAMALKYGRDYIRNRLKYRDFAQVLEREEITNKAVEARTELFNVLDDTDNANRNDFDEALINSLGAILAERYMADVEHFEYYQTPEVIVGQYFNLIHNKVLNVVKEIVKK